MLGPISGAQRASRHPARVPGRPSNPVRTVLVVGLLTAAMIVPASVAAVSSTPSPKGWSTPTTSISAPAYWLPEELFVLGLVNCTRTGGWVQKDGSCVGYGSGRYSTYVAPLRHSRGIADTVARPYARLLATRGQCSHFLDGDPGARLRRAGYTGYSWGENIGCRDGYSYARTAVLASHLNFQAEKSANGGHWRNIKNPKFVWIGIGVWKYGSRVRLVTDFYRA